MRRIVVGLAILAFVTLAPLGVRGDDRQIADEIVQRLKQQQQQGALENFNIDLAVKDGKVTLRGRVWRQEHEQLAVKIARQIDGVKAVFNELEVKEAPAEPAEPQPVQPPTKLTALETEAEPAPTTSDAQQIAQSIIGQLREKMEQGDLHGFGVQVEVDRNIVWLKGYVSDSDQLQMALDIARYTPGVKKVVNALKVTGTTAPAAVEAPVEQIATEERNDDSLAAEIARRLTAKKKSGELKNFSVNLEVHEAIASLSGHVANSEQLDVVLHEVRNVAGIKKVVNGLRVASQGQGNVVPAVAEAAAPEPAVQPQAPEPVVMTPASSLRQAAAAPAQLSQARSAPAVQTPVPFAPARPVNYQMPAAAGGPVAMHGQAVGVAPARYDHPNLPGYAWPSYAPYPNYGAVTYPQQYSATAWPYIGPFYPYPQVPLGWRKVTLEWDDGWWFLDFKSRH